MKQVMEQIWNVLPGAVMAGAGAMLCALGYRMVRFHALTVGVCAFAAAGCAAGALTGWPSLAAALCAGGAAAGYALRRYLFHVYVGAAAGLGGVAVGLLLAALTRYSNPYLLCGATAIGCTVIALLDARAITIAWTAAVGGALVSLGIVLCLPPTGGAGPSRIPWTLAAVSAGLFLGGAAFQHFTTRRDPDLRADAAPVPAPRPAPQEA
jgi:hypothetical protein